MTSRQRKGRKEGCPLLSTPPPIPKHANKKKREKKMSILYIMHVCVPQQYTYELTGDMKGGREREKKAFRLQIWEEGGGGG